ncbi:MAG: hypothetical protein E6H81_07515 [Chloroflexi bacterium]|nr:MAG: hypothetical protein E6H81_07515 [Chloroflexota bacterium]
MSGAPGEVRMPGVSVALGRLPRRVVGARVGAAVATGAAWLPSVLTTGGCSGAVTFFVCEAAKPNARKNTLRTAVTVPSFSPQDGTVPDRGRSGTV